MRKRELERFERLLMERRAQLVEQSARLSGEGRSTISEGGDDYVDDAVTHYTREFLLSLSDLDRRQLLMVKTWGMLMALRRRINGANTFRVAGPITLKRRRWRRKRQRILPVVVLLRLTT